MNDPRISLGMYQAEASTAIFTAIEGQLASVLYKNDFAQARTVVRHVCGITLATAPAGTWRYLATPVIGDPAVARGYYNSLIITPRDNGLTKTSDFDPALHQAVINEPGSFSGAITLAAHLAGRYGVTLTSPLQSGGHLESVTMVANGQAQLAAIDRMSFLLAQHDRPQDVANVRVIEETAAHPAPPLVADGGLEDDMVAALRDALLACPSLPEWPEMTRILGVTGIIVLDEMLYPPMAAVMPRAT